MYIPGQIRIFNASIVTAILQVIPHQVVIMTHNEETWEDEVPIEIY